MDTTIIMAKPTVTHLVSSLQTGGAEKFVVNLATQQQRNGLNVNVTSYGLPDDPLTLPLIEAQVPVIFACDLKLSRWRLAQRIAHADIIHIHSPAVVRALAPAFLPLLRPQVVYTVHGEVDPEQTWLRQTHRVARLYINKVTAVSEAAKLSLQPRYGWPPDLASVVENGLALPSTPLPLSDDGILRLGTVSRLVSLKNIPLLFQAIGLLSAAERMRLKVVVVGDGPERENIERAAAVIDGLNYEFTGNLTAEDAIYRLFDVLVNCSDTEGLPMSIIEAMGFGRPVIATAVGAVPSTIQEAETGWLYKPRDAQALASILRKLLSSPDSVRRVGGNARTFALQHFGIEEVSRRFETIYGLAGENT